MPGIRELGEQFAADRKITVREVKRLVAKVKQDGTVDPAEKAELGALVARFRDQFTPKALARVQEVLGTQPPPPPVSGRVVNLDPTGVQRPVYLTLEGVFSLTPDGKPPASDAERGDAAFRAAAMVDDAGKNLFQAAGVPAATLKKALGWVQSGLARVPATQGELPGPRMQHRASLGTVLLHLLEAFPASDAASRQAALAAYESMVRAETNPRLRETLIFHLSNSEAAKTSPVKEVSGRLMVELAPLTPPYSRWFANGNKTVNVAFTVGRTEFWKGFTTKLKEAGFQVVGPENQYGVTAYEKKMTKPGVGETVFRVSLKEGGTDILAPMKDAGVQIVGYDGHSNWGRNMSASVRNGPPAADGGSGKLVFYNMCVGKGTLDKVREKYPNAQVATTYGASRYQKGADDLMEEGEGVQVFLALVDGIASRSSWEALHKTMNAAADMDWTRTWDNFLTPISTLTRERVLDRDHDGQADYLDKHFNFNTFQVPEDTSREFRPIKQVRLTELLDGTRVLVSGNMINTLSEFSSLLSITNRDSKVIPDGYFDPGPNDLALVRFTRAPGTGGRTEYRMQVNSRYAHMSEEALRSVAVYEFNRFLHKSGELGLGAVDAKLNGLILVGRSLDVDEGSRDTEVWNALLARYNLPRVDRSVVDAILEAEHHDYAGSPAMVHELKSKLSAQALRELEAPQSGEPVQVVG